MNPEDVLKNNAKTFCYELEAKPLLLEIKHIFAESTVQEIECVLNQKGGIYALDLMLEILPKRDDWLKTLYNALNGRQINKPKLAAIFDKFINQPKDCIMEATSYSLESPLMNIPYFHTLKEFYPNDPPNWKYYMNKNGLHLATRLCDFLDDLCTRDKIVYEEIKKETGIKHSLIRQDTNDIMNTKQQSFPSLEKSVENDFVKNNSQNDKFSSLKNSSDVNSASVNFHQTYLPPQDEIVYQQEKAWNNYCQIPENASISVPANYSSLSSNIKEQKSTVSLPIPVESAKKIPLENKIKKEFPELKTENKKQKQVEGTKKDVPEITEIGKQVEETKKDVPEIAEIGKQVEETKKDVPEIAEIGKQVEETKKDVPEIAEIKKQVEETKKDVPEIAELKTDITESEKLIPVEADHKAVEEIEENEVPELNAVDEQASNAKDTSSVQWLSALVLVIAVSFSIVFFYKRK